MEANEEEQSSAGQESNEQIAIKKSYIWAAAGVVIVISIFVLAANAMIANAGATNSYPATGNAASAIQQNQGDKQTVQLSVKNGNYYPNTIRLKKGVPAVIEVDLNTVKGCLRGIQIPAFGVRKTVSSGDNKIEFTPDKAGTFGFSCFMGMGTGQIAVEDENGSVPAVNTVANDIPSGGSCGAGGSCGCGQ
jgi:heme/copper-type cytochrome/quinol oxidase subunit 2